MNSLPSMWREELLHPLVTHFPIGLLIVGSLLLVLSLRWQRLAFTAKLMIVLGAAAAWIAVLTGGWAEEIVGPTLCDPDVRMLHEDHAFYVSYLYTAIACFLLFVSRFRWIAAIAALVGVLWMSYVGHLGATLTYQQGAGVYKPDDQCTGFD